jgi:hypothetical protein
MKYSALNYKLIVSILMKIIWCCFELMHVKECFIIGMLLE